MRAALLALALAACTTTVSVDTDGDGRISDAEICAAACACDLDRESCEATCASAPPPQWCDEAFAVCILERKYEGPGCYRDPHTESTETYCQREAGCI